MTETSQGITKRPIFTYLLVQTFLLAIATQGWNAIYTNFAVDAVGINPDQVGLLQSIRELPGLFSITLLCFLPFIKEMRLMSLSVLLCGLGISFAGFFPSFSGLIVCSLVMSIGFHYAESESQSLTLQHYSIAESPLIIGVLRAATSAGSFAIGLLVFLLADNAEYSVLFLLIGVGCLLAGAWGLLQRDIPAPRSIQRHGLVIKRKYWLFYLLTFFSGARRQVFVVFSALLLVKVFDFSLREMALLFLLNNLINWVLNRYIGKAIIAFGERKLLSVKYFVLVIIFIAYAHSKNPWFIATLYVLEQLFFNATVAIRTFFQKIADPEDISPSMALGVTINHIAAVVVPVLGGVLWVTFDYKLPFYMGALMAVFSLITTQFIEREITASETKHTGEI